MLFQVNPCSSLKRLRRCTKREVSQRDEVWRRHKARLLSKIENISNQNWFVSTLKWKWGLSFITSIHIIKCFKKVTSWKYQSLRPLKWPNTLQVWHSESNSLTNKSWYPFWAVLLPIVSITLWSWKLTQFNLCSRQIPTYFKRLKPELLYNSSVPL